MGDDNFLKGGRMLAAALNLFGALGLTVLFGLFVHFVAAWEEERVRRRKLQDAALALGTTVSALERDEKYFPLLLQYLSNRYSSELLRNRISDLCGLLRTVWGWLASILQVIVFGVVCWRMYQDGPGLAAFMWAVFAISVLSWLASVVFSFACLLVTGRYPGEAKNGRKGLAAYAEQQAPSAAS